MQIEIGSKIVITHADYRGITATVVAHHPSSRSHVAIEVDRPNDWRGYSSLGNVGGLVPSGRGTWFMVDFLKVTSPPVRTPFEAALHSYIQRELRSE